MSKLKKVFNGITSSEVDSVEFFDGILDFKKIVKKKGKGIRWDAVIPFVPLLAGLLFLQFQKIHVVSQFDSFLLVVVLGGACCAFLSETIYTDRRLIYKLILGEISVEEIRNLKDVKIG